MENRKDVKQLYLTKFYVDSIDLDKAREYLLYFIDMDYELSRQCNILYSYLRPNDIRNMVSIVTKLYNEDREFLSKHIFKNHLKYIDPIFSPLFRELILNSIKDGNIDIIKKLIDHKFNINKYEYGEQLSYIYSNFGYIDKDIENYFLNKFFIKDNYISNIILLYSKNIDTILNIIYDIKNDEKKNGLLYRKNISNEINFILYINNMLIKDIKLNSEDYIDMIKAYKNIMVDENISDKYKFLITKSLKQSCLLNKIRSNELELTKIDL